MRAERVTRKRLIGCDFGETSEYRRQFFQAMGKICLSSPEKMQDWFFNRFLPLMTNVLKNNFTARTELAGFFAQVGKNDSMKISVYSDYPFLEQRMKAVGLENFQGIGLYDSDFFGAQKPAPRPLLSIANDMNLDPKDILVVGDRKDTDGMAACRAGMGFYFLHNSKNKKCKKTQGCKLCTFTGNWADFCEFLPLAVDRLAVVRQPCNCSN